MHLKRHPNRMKISLCVFCLGLLVAFISCRKEDKESRYRITANLNGKAYDSQPYVSRNSPNLVSFGLRVLNASGFIKSELAINFLPFSTGRYQLHPIDSNGGQPIRPTAFFGALNGGDVGCGHWILLSADSQKNVVIVEEADDNFIEGRFSATFLKVEDCDATFYADTLRFTDGYFHLEF